MSDHAAAFSTATAATVQPSAGTRAQPRPAGRRGRPARSGGLRASEREHPTSTSAPSSSAPAAHATQRPPQSPRPSPMRSTTVDARPTTTRGPPAGT